MPAYQLNSAPGVLYLSGEIDLAAAGDLLAAGKAAIADGPSLVIDLGQVTFLDSSAINVLIQLRTAASLDGKRLVLVNVPKRAHRILDITGLSDVFDIRAAGPGQASA